jgi:iron complex outermembrane receptor protein
VSGCSAFNVPAISQDVQCLQPRNNTNALASTFEIKERFTEGYGKLDFGTQLGASPLTGNVGVRYVKRELESIGNQINPTGGATPSTFERDDDDFLPSAVAKLAVSEDWIFRLGAARVIAYPNTVDLNSGVTLANNAVFVNGVQTVLGTGTGGAPDLDPFKADQADLSAEYYFGEQALVSLGLFYKDVSTFIVQQQRPETYNGVNYLVNRKVNGRITGAVAVLLRIRRMGRLRLDRELLVHRFEHADQGRRRPHPALARPVTEQRELRRLLRKGSDQRPARLQLARRLPDRLVSSSDGHL